MGVKSMDIQLDRMLIVATLSVEKQLHHVFNLCKGDIT